MTREEAITLLKKLRTFHNGTYAKAVDLAIEALQTEVVRCKDCKRYESDGGALMTCTLTDIMILDDNCFCWWGERKGGDTE